MITNASSIQFTGRVKKGLVTTSTGRIYIGDPCYYHRDGGPEEFARSPQWYQVCLMGTRWTKPLIQKLKDQGYKIRKGSAGDPCVFTTSDRVLAETIEKEVTAFLDAEPRPEPPEHLITMDERTGWSMANLSYVETVPISHCYSMVMHVNHGKGHDGGTYRTRLGQAVTVKTTFGDGFYPLSKKFMPPWAWVVLFQE
jgi:hypothetical protein